MSTIIGKIASIDGKFYAKSSDGTLRELSNGDSIYEGEIIFGDKNNASIDSIIIGMDKGMDIVMLGDETQLFDSSLSKIEFTEDETVTYTDSIQAMLENNGDNIDNVDKLETAAGEDTTTIESTDAVETVFLTSNNASTDIITEISTLEYIPISDAASSYESAATTAGEKIQDTTPINSSDDFQSTLDNAVAAERDSDAEVSDLLASANNAADLANAAITDAEQAADTLAANSNPTSADIQTAQDAINAADAAIATAQEAASTYTSHAAIAGETPVATTAINSSDDAQSTLESAVAAERDSDAEVSDLLASANNAADLANAAITDAEQAADTLAANSNPTSANIQTAQDAINAADAAIATAQEAASTYTSHAAIAGETPVATTAINSSDDLQSTLDNAVAAERDSDRSVADLQAAANKAADLANTAITDAQQAADTLIGNPNPTAADIATAQDAITAAEAAIGSAEQAAATYQNAATTAGEKIQDTTPINSSDDLQSTLDNAVAAERDSDRSVADLLAEVNELSSLSSDAAEAAQVAAQTARDATQTADNDPSTQNLEAAQATQAASDAAAAAATQAAEELSSAIDTLNTAATAAGESVDMTSAQEILASTQDAAVAVTNAGTLVNDRVSVVSDTDSHANAVSENVAEGTYTGVTLSATDADGDAITYSLAENVPFTINEDGQILTNGAIDYETTPSFTFEVTATSADGTTSIMPVTINVADVQEDVSADGVSIDIAVVSTNVEVSTQVATPPASVTSLDDIEDVTNTSDLSGSYNTYEYTNMNKSLYTGNDGVDVVEVNGNSNVISTYGGDDIINVDGSQNASIDAGEGNNRIDIDANAQSIYVGNDDDSIRIGSNANSGLDLREGDNTLDIAGNSSNIYSGSGDDSILVDGTVNGTLGSGAGNDVINIGSANGNIDSNEGNDSVTINSYSNGSVYLGGGDDTLDVGSHVNQNINAGTGNDTVTVGGKVNGTVDLGAGDDVLKIGEFVQKRIYAAEGNDSVVIEGKVKNDVMGGSGSDSIELQNYSKADWDANKDNVRSYVKEFENIKFNDGTTIDGNGNLTDGSAFNTSANTSNGEVLTTYETTISITATQNDTDASETLSSVIVDVPAGVSVKDASGNELTVTNVQVSILVVSGVATAITLVSADKLTPSEINSISASVTTTETSGDSDSAADVVGHDISEIRDTNPHADIIDENVAEGTYTGVTLSVTDADGDMITYSLPNDVPFTINEDGQIITSGAIDFEAQESYTFDVTATSADGTTSTMPVTINVTDIEEDVKADGVTASIEIGEAITNVIQIVDIQALNAAGIVDNADGTYTIDLDENGLAHGTLFSSTELEPEAINDITASVTATESNGGDTSTVEATAQIEENGTEGDDNITFDTNDTIDGGEGFDTLMMTDDISVDFSTLSDNVSNIEAIDLGEGAQNISSLSLADVMDITDADDVLKIDGDSSDTIELNKQGEDTEWKLGDFKTDAETGKSYQEATGGEGDSTVTLEISTQIDIQES